MSRNEAKEQLASPKQQYAAIKAGIKFPYDDFYHRPDSLTLEELLQGKKNSYLWHQRRDIAFWSESLERPLTSNELYDVLMILNYNQYHYFDFYRVPEDEPVCFALATMYNLYRRAHSSGQEFPIVNLNKYDRLKKKKHMEWVIACYYDKIFDVPEENSFRSLFVPLTQFKTSRILGTARSIIEDFREHPEKYPFLTIYNIPLAIFLLGVLYSTKGKMPFQQVEIMKRNYVLFNELARRAPLKLEANT